MLCVQSKENEKAVVVGSQWKFWRLADRQTKKLLIIQVFSNVLLEQQVLCEWRLGLLAFCAKES